MSEAVYKDFDPVLHIADDVLVSASWSATFMRFFEQIACVSLLIRIKIIFDLATNELYAARLFKDYSATARLRRIAKLIAAESVEVE